MARIEMTITGTTPLLIHKFGDAAQGEATSGERVSVVGHRGTPREQAEAGLYLTEEGKPMIPQPNIFRCFIDAGKFFKAGRSKVTTQKSSLIPACVDVEGVSLLIKHKEPWTTDTRPVRIPATGGRILRHRPRFDDWALTMALTLDTSLISAKLFREIVDAAGSRIGLGDFRPDCKGPFGKFVVTHWKATKS